MLPRNVLYYGVEEPLPPRVELRAGPLSAVFTDGDLRWIRCGDREILRRIYVAVRDRNWGTVLPQIRDLSVDRRARSFRITFEALHAKGGIDFRWRAAITGEESGRITFEMDGKAHTTFLRSRIGICVHHPLKECAGRPVRVRKTDGQTIQGEFPLRVSPHQPFLEIAALTHEVAPGLDAEVSFTGDVFEMEDHRNWADAGFKTYCTPLALSFPVEVRAGTAIRQSVTLALRGKASPSAGVEKAIAVRFGEPAVGSKVPGIGLGIASHRLPLTEKEAARLKRLRPAHLRVDLRLSEDYLPALRRAAAESRLVGAPLEAALFLSGAPERELEGLLKQLALVRPSVCRWLVFHAHERSTDAKWVALGRAKLAAYEPAARFFSGTNAYFAELNRGRPDPSAIDGASFSLNPQVHAFDNASMVENLAAQTDAVESARLFLGGKPVVVSPVTLRMRFNADATAAGEAAAVDELPPPVDPRQMSLFGAGWTALSIKSLARGGAASITCYETTGWCGVMETVVGSPLPQRFRSIPGGVFPLFHVLAAVADFREGEILPAESSDPLSVDALLLGGGSRRRLLVVNFTAETQRIALPAGGCAIRIMDETNAEHAMREPEAFAAEAGRVVKTGRIELRPFAVARLDWVST